MLTKLPWAAGLVLAMLAPQQQPVFRGTRETVVVPVSVFDRNGELVTNLTQEDFIVRDNGKPQVITNFTSGLQPITAAVLIDTSLSMTRMLDLARSGAEAFLDRLLPDDKAIVGTFSTRVALDEHFTSNRDDLVRALRADTSFGNMTRLFDATDAAIAALAAQDGRRVVMLFTDGCDTQSDLTWHELREHALAADVMVYVVQFRVRLQVGFSGPSRNDCLAHAEAEMPIAQSVKDVLRVADSDRIVPSGVVMSTLSGVTGGGWFTLGVNDDVNSTFTRVMTELHYQYMLGFTPQKFDAKLHDLTVTVPDRKMTLRTRRSYQAPRPGG